VQDAQGSTLEACAPLFIRWIPGGNIGVMYSRWRDLGEVILFYIWEWKDGWTVKDGRF
jgi:hypothetical protein